MTNAIRKIALSTFLHLSIGAAGVFTAGGGQAQPGNAAPPAAAKKLTASEEELLVVVVSTWNDFVEKAASKDMRALDYLVPELRMDYSKPAAFSSLANIKSLQKDFDIIDISKTSARLATVLTNNGADSLHYVMLEKRGARWYITGL